MTPMQFVKPAGAVAAVALLGLAGMSISSPRVHADDDDQEAKVKIGFEIAPKIKLNLVGKDRDLVGLGSYIVNGPGDCNACHNPGPGNNQFLPGGNPFFGQHPTVVNPKTYLGGGRDFGTLDPGGKSAHIISRNLTPDKTGLPEGGHTFAEFLQIMRNGKDFDHLHPACKGNTLTPTCVPAPFDDDLLQIMPWPNFQHMTDHDLLAVWTYLSAIPCIDTIVAGQPLLRNVCQ